MTSIRRDRWGIVLGVLAGAVLIVAGVASGVSWLVWVGVVLALAALCLWPLLGARRDRENPKADSSLEEPSRSPRAVGGETDAGDADRHSTTGPSRNDTFVGRVSGTDAGAEETSGAERRTEDGEGGEPRS